MREYVLRTPDVCMTPQAIANALRARGIPCAPIEGQSTDVYIEGYSVKVHCMPEINAARVIAYGTDPAKFYEYRYGGVSGAADDIADDILDACHK